MFWIIAGGTLLAFFYLLIFSLCITAKKADRTIELNLQKMESENTEGIDKVLFEEPFNETIHEGLIIPDNRIESCEDAVAIAKIGLAKFSRG